MICHALSTQKKHTSEPKKRVLGLVHSNHQSPFCKALTIQEAWCTNGRNVDSNWVITSNSQLPHSTISVSLSFAVMFHSQGTCHVEVAIRSFSWACPGGVSTFHASLEGLRVPRWPPIGVKIHYGAPCILYIVQLPTYVHEAIASTSLCCCCTPCNTVTSSSARSTLSRLAFEARWWSQLPVSNGICHPLRP